MWLNVRASSNSETFSRGGSISLSCGGSISLMHEVGVVREVILAVLGRIERVRRLVGVRELPVAVEHRLQAADDGRVVGHDAQLRSEERRVGQGSSERCRGAHERGN